MDRYGMINYGDGDTITYTYDTTNNPTGEAHSAGGLKEYVYDAYNRLLEVKWNGETTDTYAYNSVVTKHNDAVYTCDRWEKLKSVAKNGKVCYYRYNADGIRTGKAGTQYFTDPNNNVVAEANDDGTAKAEIVCGNQALSRKVGPNWYYYQSGFLYPGRGMPAESFV